MKTTNDLLKELVKEKYDKEQTAKVERLMEIESDRFLITYSTLAIGIESELIYGDAQVIKDFYNIDDLKLLNTVDILIAKIVITLSNLTGMDVKKGYEESMSLDISQPEVKYLIEVMSNYFL